MVPVAPLPLGRFDRPRPAKRPAGSRWPGNPGSTAGGTMQTWSRRSVSIAGSPVPAPVRGG